MEIELHPTQATLIEWSSKCSIAIGEYFDLCKPFLWERPRIDPKLQFVLSQLGLSCHLSSESTCLLISNVRLWDADILIRAVTEGTFKFAFLCTGDDSERALKTAEYWDYLPEMTRLKRHQRVADFLSKLDDSDAEEWKPIRDLLIESDELAALQAKYPQKARQQIEQKWAFNAIARNLTLTKVNANAYKTLKSMDFSYGLASHLVHQDADAISVIWDRNRREPERFESIQLAHGNATGFDDFQGTQRRRKASYCSP